MDQSHKGNTLKVEESKIEVVRSLDNLVEQSLTLALNLLLPGYYVKEKQSLSYLSHFCFYVSEHLS